MQEVKSLSLIGRAIIHNTAFTPKGRAFITTERLNDIADKLNVDRMFAMIRASKMGVDVI